MDNNSINTLVSIKKLYLGGKRYQLVTEQKPIELLCSMDIEKEDYSHKKEYIPEYIDKKVLYITNFSTVYRHRNKGYAKHLLGEVIKNLKDKYDIIHLNACPYYIKDGYAVYEAPDNGLDMNRLIGFYESFGFEMCGTTKEGFKVMLLK